MSNLRIVLSVALVLIPVFCTPVLEDELSKALGSKVLLIDNIESFKHTYPDLELIPLSKTVATPFNNVRYTLGSRLPGDRLVAANNDYTSWPTLHDVQLVLTYPTSGIGALVSYVQIDVQQSSNLGQGYVVAGGIGQRSIQIVVEAYGTSYFGYDANIYGL